MRRGLVRLRAGSGPAATASSSSVRCAGVGRPARVRAPGAADGAVSAGTRSRGGGGTAGTARRRCWSAPSSWAPSGSAAVLAPRAAPTRSSPSSGPPRRRAPRRSGATFRGPSPVDEDGGHLGFKQLRGRTGTASAGASPRGGSTATSRRPRYAPAVIITGGWHRRRWSPSSGPPRPASPTSASRSPRPLGGEVVNADAMQLYRGMDIGTAKLAAGRARAASRTTCSTSSTSPRPPRSPPTSGRRGRIVERPARRGPHAGAGRRLRAVRPGRASTTWSSPAPTPQLRAELEAELADRRARGAARPAGRGRPGRRGGGAAEQRPPDRAGAGGDRADRPPVPGAARRPAGRPRYDAVLLGVDRATARARRAGRPPGGPDVRRRAGRGDPRRCSRAGCGRAGPRRGRWATSRSWPPSTAARATWRGGRRDGPRHPPVRPPAALLVPPRPRGSSGSTRGPDLLERAAVVTLRPGHDRHRVQQGPRHRERLRRCSPTPTATLDLTPPGSPRSATAGAGSAPTACCGSCAGRARATAPRRRRAGRRVVHGLPQRRRQRRRDVRQRRAGLRPLPRDAGWLPDGATLAARHPRRGPRRCAPTGDEVVASTWARRRVGPAVDRARSARGRSPGVAVDVGNPHLACVTDVALDALDLTAAARPRPRRCSRTG